MQDKLLLLHDLLSKISHISDEDELARLTDGCLEKLGVSEGDVLYTLCEDARGLGHELLALVASGADAARRKKLAALSDEEKAVVNEVERVINENCFGYHFQPIVNTTDGGIFSYEALMRPQSEMKLSPFQVLKYAELTGRLNEIERATFLNVLGIIDRDPSAFGDRKVFINSIPRTKLDSDDLRRVGELMMKHSDSIVVEFTENAEFDENELRSLQERYRNMDIKIALDDYGTGYSNVQNLLRYNPNYVKIDHTLLADIQNSPKKRHFVREIIGFCHDNGIQALAEGVETAEELRTVILLGADLIQGFYTARPAAELIDSIPNEIRQEIRLCQQERQEGRDQQVYTAENNERVLLPKLAKDDYKCIFIGKQSVENSEVTVIGAPTLDTEIHIEVAPNYRGRIVLENAHLSNVKSRPCIDIGENCDVTLVLYGENRLNSSGILVPQSSKLTVIGEGNLVVNANDVEYFGIGNVISECHGELVFDQMGTVTINADGKTGICIGSGMGGEIGISRGRFILNINGELGVGIGALYADTRLGISNCDINADISLAKGAGIGSIGSSADITLSKMSAKFYMSGKELSAVGTIGGNSANILITEANVITNINAYRCTCLGALDESTRIRMEKASLRTTANGQKALPFGGFSGDTKVSFYHSDTTVKLMSEIDKDKYILSGKIETDGGKTRVTVNGYDVDIEPDVSAQ